METRPKEPSMTWAWVRMTPVLKLLLRHPDEARRRAQLLCWFWKNRDVRLLLVRRALLKKRLWPWARLKQRSGPEAETHALVCRTVRWFVMGIVGSTGTEGRGCEYKTWPPILSSVWPHSPSGSHNQPVGIRRCFIRYGGKKMEFSFFFGFVKETLIYDCLW